MLLSEEANSNYLIIGNKRDFTKFEFNLMLSLINADVNLMHAMLYRGYYTVARRYDFYVRVARTISHE